MPVLVAIALLVLGGAWYWVRRNPRQALDDAQDLAETLKNAPRRWSFRSDTTRNPIEYEVDERVLICAIGQAFLELDALPTQEQRDLLHVAMRTSLRCGEEEAREMAVRGRWYVNGCNGVEQAVLRLARGIKKVRSEDAWETLQVILGQLVGEELSQRQIDAVSDLRGALGRS